MDPPKPTVLVVEDDLEVREAIAETVEAIGHHVEVASNGLEALDYLHRHPDQHCVVLLDMMMPVMDGWTFLDILRQESIHVPLVIVTAAEPSELPPGVATVRKPLERETLRRTLEVLSSER